MYEYKMYEYKTDRKQQENAYTTTGLPPLAPVHSGESTHHIHNIQHTNAHNTATTTGNIANTAEYYHHHPHAVPSQIHLDEEEITLTSEVTDRGTLHGSDMKKVNSIEKLGKLWGQMYVVSVEDILDLCVYCLVLET